MDWLIDQLIDRSIDWSIDSLIDWLTDRLIDWLIDWSFDWLMDWLIDWLIGCSISTAVQDDLKITQESLRKILEIAKANDVVTELPAVFSFLKFVAIALGMIHWIGKTVKEPSYFKFAGESRNTPVHLIIVDEIATLHPTLHRKILDLLVELFEAPWPQLDVLIRLELQKMFLDRMTHLVSCGCVLPVLEYVRGAFAKQDTDVSVFRHFVLELLDVIAPPYSAALVRHLLPLVSDNAVTGMLRLPDGKDPVSMFIEDCKQVDVAWRGGSVFIFARGLMDVDDEERFFPLFIVNMQRSVEKSEKKPNFCLRNTWCSSKDTGSRIAA